MDTSAIFKAYDVRGTYPDQLDERVAEAVGSAFATFAASPRVVLARDMRSSGVTLSECLRARRAPRRGGGRRPRARLDRLPLLRLGLPRRARGDVHRLAQPRPLQRDQALPRRRQARRPRVGPRRHRAPDHGPSTRRRPRASLADYTSLDLTNEWVAHVHSFVDVGGLSSAQDRRRHRERHGRLRRSARLRRTALRPRDPLPASSTARSRITPPTRSTPRTSRTSSAGSSRSAPTSGSPSTVTPTASFSSTRRPSQ